MALQANALLDVKDVFDYMKMALPATNDPNYILVESLINRASDYAETYTNGPLINKSFTINVDGSGDVELMIAPYPIQSLSSVTVDGVSVTSNVDFYSEGVLFLKDGNIFTKGRKNVAITYTSGYGADKNTIPQDIKQAALLIVHYWYKRDSLDYSQTFGESEVIVGQWRFPSTATKILDQYRRIRAAVV